MPKVSIILPVYNKDEYLSATLNLLINQSYQDWELIVVDDGSTDDSCSVIESIKDPRIKLYRLEQNEHISHATNYGFQKVT